MAMVAHDPKAAKRVGIPQSVGREYVAADKGRKFSKGGTMSVEKKVAPSKMGAVKTAAPSRDGVAIKGKTRGKQVKMAGGKGMKSGGMTKGKC